MKKILAIAGLCFMGLFVLSVIGLSIYKAAGDELDMVFYVFGGFLFIVLLKLLFDWCIENI
jgi:hypothetical protein